MSTVFRAHGVQNLMLVEGSPSYNLTHEAAEGIGNVAADLSGLHDLGTDFPEDMPSSDPVHDEYGFCSDKPNTFALILWDFAGEYL